MQKKCRLRIHTSVNFAFVKKSQLAPLSFTLIFENPAEELLPSVRGSASINPSINPKTMDLVIHAGTLSVRDPSKDHFVERFAPLPRRRRPAAARITTRASSAAEPRVLHAELNLMYPVRAGSLCCGRPSSSVTFRTGKMPCRST